MPFQSADIKRKIIQANRLRQGRVVEPAGGTAIFQFLF
jgi:hypothetical protein